MFYLYEVATGKLLSNSAEPITTSNPALAVKEIVGAVSGVWNTTTLSMDPYPVDTRISTGDFFDLFTQDELELLITRAKTQVKPQVFLKRLDLKARVDRADPLLIADMQAMVSAGVLTLARAQEIMSV